ncbi:MAG: LCP family protein, partial [Thermanaerothrix sp.]|uniref:LCP family protein n=1 Tax=Thermanaerothrix sp. TaxID=2972675 RepID=UPI003C7BEF0C
MAEAQARVTRTGWRGFVRGLSGLILLVLTACTRPAATATATLTLASPTLSATAPPSPAPTPVTFFTPQATAALPIPPPLTVDLPAEVRTLVLLGSDAPAPHLGRTDAIMLVFYHPRLGRASLLSVPPDLYVYLPGFTLQRLNVAYALGGWPLVADTLAYNLGVRPQDFALVHLPDFVYLIDDLGGLELTILSPPPPMCGDIPLGTHLLSGDQVLCYLRVREGEGEIERNARQQQVLEALFLRLVQGGNLVRLPDLYRTYRNSVETTLGLEDLLTAIPLALRLGDPGHLGFFRFSPQALSPYLLSEQPRVSVFLPNRTTFQGEIQDAINYVLTPVPFSARVLTLEYELTISPTPTLTPTPTQTPTVTLTSTPSPTLVTTPTPSPTPSLSPT